MARRNGFPQTWQEARRKRAFELKQHGWKQREIAEALGVSPAAVSQWLAHMRELGLAIRCVRRQLHLITACFAEAGLSLED